MLYAFSGPFATSKDALKMNARAANFDLAKSLNDGKDLKTVIYIGSSKYSFTISSNNFEKMSNKLSE